MTAHGDQWAWWKAALKGERGPITADEPMAGFYETRSKNRATGEETRGIAAYWYDRGQWELAGFKATMYCRVGGAGNARMLDDLRARERWPFVSKRPIPKETYDAVAGGLGWPDESPAARADRAATSDHTPRSNSQAALDPESLAGIAERVDNLSREAERLVKAGAAKTKEASDQASDLADRLLKLEKLSDAKRRDTMKPHEEAAAAVDAQWRPLRDKAADLKGRLKSIVVTPFLLEARRQAMIEAQAEAKATGTTISERAIAARAAPAGTTSRTSLRDNRTAKITDYKSTLAFFAENEKVKALIQQLANASVRSGTTPPGCEVDTKSAAA